VNIGRAFISYRNKGANYIQNTEVYKYKHLYVIKELTKDVRCHEKVSHNQLLRESVRGIKLLTK
jgi:hypothetical protein